VERQALIQEEIAMRTRKLLASLALASTVLAGVAGSASAAPSENANCVGQQFSYYAQQGGAGRLVSEFAREVGGLGQVIAPAASANCEGLD